MIGKNHIAHRQWRLYCTHHCLSSVHCCTIRKLFFWELVWVWYIKREGKTSQTETCLQRENPLHSFFLFFSLGSVRLVVMFPYWPLPSFLLFSIFFLHFSHLFRNFYSFFYIFSPLSFFLWFRDQRTAKGECFREDKKKFSSHVSLSLTWRMCNSCFLLLSVCSGSQCIDQMFVSDLVENIIDWCAHWSEP